MPHPKLYLDVCCFKRPFDDQTHIVIRLETEAKLYIQNKIKEGLFDLVWSYMIDYENDFNPFPSNKESISRWRFLAIRRVKEDDAVVRSAREFQSQGLKTKDSIHLACAVSAGCDFFITTDKGIPNKSVAKIQAINPIDFVKITENVK